MMRILRLIWGRWIKPSLGPLAVIFVIGSGIWYLNYQAPLDWDSDPTIINFARVFGSLLLSALLLILYSQMAYMQSRQADIMDADQRPVLKVNDQDYAGDEVALKIENVGNGIALDPELHFHVLCYDSFEPESENELHFGLTNESNKLRNEDGTVAELSTTGYKLPHEIFSRACVQSVANPSLDRTLSEALETARNIHDFDQLYYQIEISYDHLMADGDRAHKFLQPYRVPLQQGMSMEDLNESREAIQSDFSKFTESDEYTFRESGTYYFTRGGILDRLLQGP